MKLRLFASHIFDRQDLKLSLPELRSVIAETVEEFSNQVVGEDLEFEVYFEDAEFGAVLPTSIRSNILGCDIFCCDLSGLSPNVLYELGFAHGSGKQLVVLRDSVGPVKIPTDIQDLLVATYSTKETLKFQLLQRLSSVISSMRASGWRELAIRNASNLWFEASPSRISIVCSTETEATRFADPKSNAYVFIDNLEDRDALVDVSMFLSRSFPNAGIQRQIAEGLAQDALESDIVVLGGPRSNPVTRDLLELLGVELDQGNGNMSFSSPTGDTVNLEVIQNDEGLITKDVGYLGIFANPLRKGARIILCIGSNIFGTHGSAKALDDSPQGILNSITLREAIGLGTALSFKSAQMIFHVPVMQNRKVTTPVLEKERIWVDLH